MTTQPEEPAMNAQALAERTADQLPLAPALSEAASLMEVITRAARDPDTDVDKLERMMGMYERITTKQAEQAFNEAMTQAQGEMLPIAANANNPQTHSKYATYDALDAALRPIYTKHGFSPSFDSGDGAPPEHVRVLCYLSHSGGFTRTYRMDMPADGKGAKGGDVMTKTHATGSAFTYGQRYLLAMMFNVAVSGKRDDDGNAAGAKKAGKAVSPEQVKTLLKMIEDAGATAEQFCEIAKIEAVPELRANHFDNAVSWLQERIKARSAKAKPKVDPKAQFDQMESGR